MFRPPSALLQIGSVFYMTGNPLVYVACDGRRIRLRAVQGHDDFSPPRHGAAPGFGPPWDFVPGHITGDCLFVGMRGNVWAIYEAGVLAGVQPPPARLSLARKASISSSMSATRAASSGAAS